MPCFITSLQHNCRPYQSIDYGTGSQLIVGACLPHGQRVAGKIPVDVLLQKINFPDDSGLKVDVRVVLNWAGGNMTYQLTQKSLLRDWTCSTPGNCRTIVSIMVRLQGCVGGGRDGVSVEVSGGGVGSGCRREVDLLSQQAFNNAQGGASTKAAASCVCDLEHGRFGLTGTLAG